MKFNTTAIKAALFSVLVSASSAVFAGNFGYPDDRYRPTPTPTPYCDPTPGNNIPPPAAVPEPSAWISFAIGAALIIGLTIYNKTKAAKTTN